jgi:hypothetical protein
MTYTDLSCNAGIHVGFEVQSFLQSVHYIVHVFLEIAPSVDRYISGSSYWGNELPHVESRSSRTLSAGTLAVLTAEAMVTRREGIGFWERLWDVKGTKAKGLGRRNGGPGLNEGNVVVEGKFQAEQGQDEKNLNWNPADSCQWKVRAPTE